MAESAPSLEALEISMCQAGPVLVSRVARACPQLRDLYLTASSVDDSALACVGARCVGLRTLDVTFCTEISDEGLREIALRCGSAHLPLAPSDARMHPRPRPLTHAPLTAHRA